MIRIAIASILLIGACAKQPDPEDIEVAFAQCMKEARDASLVGRVMSPTDECHRYAVDIATRKANQ